MTVEIRPDGEHDVTDKQDLSEYSAYQRALLSLQKNASETFNRNARPIRTAIAVVLVLLYFAYLGYALYYRYVQLLPEPLSLVGNP